MNNYLLLLGGNFAEIRQILNLTQEDLANRMGVSRPTIVKIEQDSSRFSKTLAFAFFVAITYEMRNRIKKVNALDPHSYNESETLHKFIEEIRKSSLLPIGTLVTAATISLSGLIPGIGAVIAAAAGMKYFKSAKQNSDEKLKQSVKWDEEKAKKVLEEVHKKLLDDQQKVLNCFQLNSFDIEQFVEKIDEGELLEEW